jgi:hypothetical protein
VREKTLIQFNPAGASRNGGAMIRQLREVDDAELTVRIRWVCTR